MEIINAYLETMFAPYPNTARLQAAKAELKQMMEDAYVEARAGGATENEAVGQVITEFGNLDEVAGALGIATDVQAPVGSDRTLPLAEAMDFAQERERTQPVLALAVSLFVLSPTVLIALQAPSWNPLGDGVRVLVGLAFLLILVAVGVAVLVKRDSDLSRFHQINHGHFDPSPELIRWAEALREQHRPRRTRALVAAICLWVCSVLPFLAAIPFDEAAPGGDSAILLWGVPGTLILVALGLAIFLPADWASEVADQLVKPEEEDEEWKDAPPLVRAVMAAYWPLVVTIYLAWSFLSDAWGSSWVIFPIAGVLFGAMSAFLGAWKAKDQQR
ncbi:permease prefix domain 1-containing protein [Scrofimicrobium sp. R131]|uniref:Permease prefix domain 1-containing protein n=1 Tax=Scrofimicrobium appendicitidis TaxID=3079930 RepID=A0AAU7V6C0_9ACTO